MNGAEGNSRLFFRHPILSDRLLIIGGFTRSVGGGYAWAPGRYPNFSEIALLHSRAPEATRTSCDGTDASTITTWLRCGGKPRMGCGNHNHNCASRTLCRPFIRTTMPRWGAGADFFLSSGAGGRVGVVTNLKKKPEPTAEGNKLLSLEKSYWLAHSKLSCKVVLSRALITGNSADNCSERKTAVGWDPDTGLAGWGKYGALTVRKRSLMPSPAPLVVNLREGFGGFRPN